MEKDHSDRNLGMLCRCCDYRSYKLPDLEWLDPKERELIEALCKLCLEHNRLDEDIDPEHQP